MATPIFPKAQSDIAGNLLPTREWLDFFRDLLDRVNADEGLAAEIDAIILRLEALEAAGDATISGPNSVQVFGSLSEGLVTLMLRNDVQAPGNTYYYGTGPTGIKGWHTVASALEATQDGIALVVGADGVTDIQPDDDLAAVEALATTGLATRTAADTWVTRALTAGAGADVTNGDGVAGNPTVAHADTSAVANLTSDNSGTVVLQDIAFTFDTFGHVLTATVGTVDVATALSLDHGTYTPTLTGVANVDSATPQQFQYMRVGNTVTVSGRIDVDATAAGSTLTQVGVSLPIASNLAATTNLAGAGGAGTTPYAAALIIGDTANDRATFAYYSTSTTSVACLLTFTYLVI